jgi:hypothetical protein
MRRFPPLRIEMFNCIVTYTVRDQLALPQCEIEKPAGGVDKRVSLEIFLISGLFADENQL